MEKARVISQQSLERSYHIFYQIMSGAISGLKGIFIVLTNRHPTHTHLHTHIITLYPSINPKKSSISIHLPHTLIRKHSRRKKNVSKIPVEYILRVYILNAPPPKKMINLFMFMFIFIFSLFYFNTPVRF